MIIFFSYIFYFIAASASPLQRRWLAKKKDVPSSEQTHFAFHVILVSIAGTLFFPFFSPFYFSGSKFYLFFLALVCGLFGAGYSVFNYIAQKHLDAGVTSVVSNIYTPITIVLSSFLIHEGLNYQQILGTILLLVALFVISKKHRISRFRFDKYFLLMLASGAMLGIVLVAERALQKATGFSAGTMLSWWSQCLFLGLATFLVKSRHNYTKKDVISTGALRFFQGLSYVILVYIVGNLSYVSSITTFKVVIIFIAAAIFLREREDLGRKIIGSIIAAIGLLLMK
ncbi:MAG TPA: DMT family transporter [Candidatus Paceibacterota bacterium]|jgi:uncharacterized membrane protein|nr:DMT family transporter [Candidatus Paceibacterota bacterium]